MLLLDASSDARTRTQLNRPCIFVAASGMEFRGGCGSRQKLQCV